MEILHRGGIERRNAEAATSTAASVARNPRNRSHSVGHRTIAEAVTYEAAT